VTLAVLLVEDERDTRESLARAIVRAGHTCVAASNASSALAMTVGATIDVAVVDIVLEGAELGGLDLLQHMRAQGVIAPVVMITAFADVEKVKRALNGGADHLLEKPFKAAELLELVGRFASRPNRPRDRATAIEDVLCRARLTAKERTVAMHLLEGLSSSEIAVLEANSPKTIRQHVSQIYAKCGVGSRAEFFRLAYTR
jgi:FixJ family two-component response regulator